MLKGAAFTEIREVIRSNSFAGFPIVTQTNRLVGYITREVGCLLVTLTPFLGGSGLLYTIVGPKLFFSNDQLHII